MPDLFELNGAIGTVSDPLIVMQRVVDEAVDLVGAADGAAIGMLQDGRLRCVAAAGTLQARVGAWLGEDGDGELPDAATAPVAVPLRHQGRRLGALLLSATRPGAIGAADLALLRRLGGFVGVTVGASWELSRITRDLLDAAAAAPVPEPPPGQPEQDRISRFVANVLQPGVVADLDARRRIQALLDCPSLTMRCQPIVDAHTGELVGAEALARFPRPHRPPDAWFDDAERAGLGKPLQLAAVGLAVRLLDALPPGAYLTINVGPDVLAAPELLELLAGVDCRRIVLELTEHLQIDDYAGLHASISAVRRLGARLAIDDTGAGFASLGHIVNLGPEMIKLDRQFTRRIDADPVRRALAQALLSFAREIGAEVVSEGIETAAELETIRALGIPYGQGYFIGRPMAVELLTESYAHTNGRALRGTSPGAALAGSAPCGSSRLRARQGGRAAAG